MVDGSWSIGTKNFEQIRQFLYTLVNSFDVGPDRVRIGLVQYSTTPRTEFLLNTYQNKSDILDYISKLPYMGGGTETGLGLDFMMREHFIDAAGSRAKQNVPQIAVVITDGKSQDNVESHANELKKKGIVIYAIGIKEADEEQLREIANLPHSQHVYSVSDFTALQGISLSVVQTLCTTVEEAKRQLLQLSTGKGFAPHKVSGDQNLTNTGECWREKPRPLHLQANVIQVNTQTDDDLRWEVLVCLSRRSGRLQLTT